MNLKLSNYEFFFSAAVFIVATSFATQTDASDTDLKLNFESSIERFSGIEVDQLPPELTVGSKVSGEIIIEESRRTKMDTGDGFAWDRDGKGSVHVLVRSPLLSSFRSGWLVVQRPPGGKIAINCTPQFCNPSGELKTIDGRFWRAGILSVQALRDTVNVDIGMKEATDLLKSISNDGGAKILLTYNDKSNESIALRIVLAISALDYQ